MAEWGSPDSAAATTAAQMLSQIKCTGKDTVPYHFPMNQKIVDMGCLLRED